jgi:hypothetical protein
MFASAMGDCSAGFGAAGVGDPDLVAGCPEAEALIASD